jgi:hypothetical protein
VLAAGAAYGCASRFGDPYVACLLGGFAGVMVAALPFLPAVRAWMLRAAPAEGPPSPNSAAADAAQAATAAG